MGISAYIVIGKTWTPDMEEYKKLGLCGAAGFLNRPIYDFPVKFDEGPRDMDFIAETPKVLNWIQEQLKQEIYDIEDEIKRSADGRPDAEHVIIELEYIKYQCSELIDFMLLGCKLQLADKHPMIIIT